MSVDPASARTALRAGEAAPEPGVAEAANRVTCGICPHACTLAEGQRGRCRARVARAGRVIDENYGRITSLALDPIEKKPLARFRPGSLVLSLGSYGCNLRCPFCQNASIAQAGENDVPWVFVPPDELVERARALAQRGNIGLAYTYNEPLVGFEYVYDCAVRVREAGLANLLVSNGTVSPDPLARLLPLIDAANIDLKGFDERFYRRIGGDFATVRATIEAMAAAPDCHLEVTTLVIPGENDDPAVIDAAACWLASLDPDIPYHVSRFFPCHLMVDRDSTPVADVYRLADVARRHLNHVFVGNC